jgi:hypothetical protein
VDFSATWIAEDDTGAKETDAGDDALHDTASRSLVWSLVLACQHNQGSSKGNDTHRPHAGRLAAQIPVQADSPANQGGSGQA